MLIISEENQQAFGEILKRSIERGELAELWKQLMHLHDFGGDHKQNRVLLFPSSREDYFDWVWEQRFIAYTNTDGASGTWRWERQMNGGLVYHESSPEGDRWSSHT